MKPKYESVMKIILLLIILYSSSFVSFAQSKKSRNKRIATDQITSVPVVTRAPDLSDAPLLPAPTTKDSIQSSLAPQLKKRHKVAIVPAPPPGQIPVYVPAKH